MTDQLQKWLYMCNQQVLTPTQYAEFHAAEAEWINTLAARIDTESCTAITNYSEFDDALNGFVKMEAKMASPGVAFLCNDANIDAFRIMVMEFAIDGLTEAKAFFHVLPRLPLEAQMPLLRIMIDEFGAGNVHRAHTTLYRKLLTELQMSTEVSDYYDQVSETSYAFVNIFYWLCLRCPQPEVFIGALTYLESSIPSFFSHYVRACVRLGIRNLHYYSEHVHIDHYHALDGRRTLRALSKYGECDYRLAWKGVLISSFLIGQAFDVAAERARRAARG